MNLIRIIMKIRHKYPRDHTYYFFTPVIEDIVGAGFLKFLLFHPKPLLGYNMSKKNLALRIIWVTENLP